MTSESKLKDEARRAEQREEWERAIQIYLQILRGSEERDTESDLPIYNRVGDLYIRLNRPAEAVSFYEQAADRYAEAGLYNNAIALCNKALRHQPGRIALFRKLGQYCAHQGFLTDARRWYLEFADRMVKQGKRDEALDALEDFANISDDPDIRLHLGRQLYANDRREEALDAFRRAYAMLLRAGDEDAAGALREEVLALDAEAPDLAEEETTSLTPTGEAELGALPEYGDVPTEAAPPFQAAKPMEDAETGSLEGLESTTLADPSRMEEVAGQRLEGLDTGRDDTLDRAVEDEAESEESSPLPLLDDEERPAAAGLPLLDDAPGEAEPAAPAPDPFGGARMDLGPEPARDAVPTGEGEYVDLYALLAPDEDRVEKSRFFIEETEPTGDEDHDFAELLKEFRRKLAEHVPEHDAGSHYDLGLAFKEMGLYDDAISEFQIALRAGQDRLKVFEELGQCFLLKGQNNIAVKVLSRALQLDHRDEFELIGVYYHLGRAHEELGQNAAARDAYERVMGLDIRFADVEARMARL
jgi:tetratricopeptide (TPR) repeat protein